MTSAAAGAQTGAGKFWYLTIAAVVLAFDQLTKYWAYARLRDAEDKVVIPGLLNLSYTENPGIAFGMLSNGNVKWLLVAVSVVAIVVVIYYMMRTASNNALLLWSLALLVAGIAGNLIDRIRMGRVIDFIDVYYRTYHWPVFNVADAAITIGAALMAIELFITPQAEDVPGARDSYASEGGGPVKVEGRD